MQEIAKNIDEIRLILFSGQQDLVIETIHGLKETSHFELVDSLFDLYLTSSDNIVKKELFQFFVEIKDKRFVTVLVNNLSKSKFKTVTKDLVSICWQTGLQFESEIELFSKIMVENDIETAIECFSVIEESIFDISEEKRKSLLVYFNESLPLMEETKKDLVKEIIHLLE